MLPSVVCVFFGGAIGGVLNQVIDVVRRVEGVGQG